MFTVNLVEYFDYCQQEDSLFRKTKVRYRGIFFSGCLIDLECKHVDGKCSDSEHALIPDGSFQIGMRYNLKFGDPLDIKGLKYIGEGKINLPGPYGPYTQPIKNSYFIFAKGAGRVYIHTTYSYYKVVYSSLLLRIWKWLTK